MWVREVVSPEKWDPHKLWMRSQPALQISRALGNKYGMPGVAGAPLLSVRPSHRHCGGLHLLSGSQCSAWYSDCVWVLGMGSDRSLGQVPRSVALL